MAVDEERGRRAGGCRDAQRSQEGEARRKPRVSGRAPPGALRVLISFTPAYAAYGEALFRGLRRVRPALRLRLAPRGEAVGAVVRGFRPHLVVSDEPVAAGRAASLRISAEPTLPSTMRAGKTVRTVVNPSFEDLLAFVDDVAGAVGEGR